MDKSTAPYYLFNTHPEAEEAIRELGRSGFDMKKLSLIGKGYHTEEHPVGFYTAGDRIKTWGGVGAFWGGFWGLLFAPAVFFLPGLGLVALAGPIVAALKVDQYVLMVHGNAEEMAKAQTVLENSKAWKAA